MAVLHAVSKRRCQYLLITDGQELRKGVSLIFTLRIYSDKTFLTVATQKLQETQGPTVQCLHRESHTRGNQRGRQVGLINGQLVVTRHCVWSPLNEGHYRVIQHLEQERVYTELSFLQSGWHRGDIT